MKTETQNTKQNLLNKKQFIIGLIAILVIGIVGASVFSAANADKPETTGIYAEKDGDSFVAKPYNSTSVESYKYTIRDDTTCDSSVFSDGGSDAGNLTDVVYNSNSYTPADKSEIDLYNDKYICFAGNLTDGGWSHDYSQLDWHLGATIASQTVDCEPHEIATTDGICIPADGSEVGAEVGAGVECEEGEVATPGGTCILDESEEDPCESQEDTSPECLASTSSGSEDPCAVAADAGTAEAAFLERLNQGETDFSSIDLSHAFLPKVDLSGDIDLSGANLRCAYLEAADLSHADLSSADLTGAYLERANLSYADLSSADLTGAYLEAADLSHADLTSADLTDAYLERANLSYADLSSADLTRAYLKAADLANADLSSADLTDAYLEQCNDN